MQSLGPYCFPRCHLTSYHPNCGAHRTITPGNLKLLRAAGQFSPVGVYPMAKEMRRAVPRTAARMAENWSIIRTAGPEIVIAAMSLPSAPNSGDPMQSAPSSE